MPNPTVSGDRAILLFHPVSLYPLLRYQSATTYTDAAAAIPAAIA